jgi:hypothetical protein
MDRSIEIFNGEGELENTLSHDVEWGDIYCERDMWLRHTDMFALYDRFILLTEEQQIQITEFRQSWRDITDFDDANEAADNAPICPEWAKIWDKLRD